MSPFFPFLFSRPFDIEDGADLAESTLHPTDWPIVDPALLLLSVLPDE